MSDRDIERVADAAADGLRKQLARAMEPILFKSTFSHGPATDFERRHVLARIDHILPVVEAYAAAQVAEALRPVEALCEAQGEDSYVMVHALRAAIARGAP